MSAEFETAAVVLRLGSRVRVAARPRVAALRGVLGHLALQIRGVLELRRSTVSVSRRARRRHWSAARPRRRRCPHVTAAKDVVRLPRRRRRLLQRRAEDVVLLPLLLVLLHRRLARLLSIPPVAVLAPASGVRLHLLLQRRRILELGRAPVLRRVA
jgi:hypothetical protein